MTFALLLLLLAVLPFETSGALLRLPPVVFTALEVLLYAFLGCWAAGCLWKRRVSLPPAGVAWLLAAFVAAQLASALLAPEERLNAFKAAARLATGAVLFLAAFDLGATRKRILALCGALVLGGVAAAVLALLEVWDVGDVGPWLYRSFEFRPMMAGAIRRASGPLTYPNVLSMYLEMSVPALLALLALRPRVRPLLWLALAALLEAVVLTYSRAGLLTTLLLVLAMTAAAALQRNAPGRQLALQTALVALGVAALQPLSQTEFFVRWFKEPATWYSASYTVPPVLRRPSASQTQIGVTVRNTGAITWVPSGVRPFHLSYHWFDGATLRPIEWDGSRTVLPAAVAPGEAVTLQALVSVPPGLESGDVLAWDMVQEHSSWFSERGVAMGLSRVDSAPALAGHPHVQGGPLGEEGVFLARRRELWRIAFHLLGAHPWLGIGPDNYRLLYGRQLATPALADDRTTSNNLYIEKLVGSGLIGGGLFLALLACWLRDQYRGLSDPGVHAERLVALGIALVPGAILLHGLVDECLGRTAIYAAFWTMLAASWRFTGSGVRSLPEHLQGQGDRAAGRLDL